MATTHLVTGGSRSGKSAYAQQQAESGGGSRLFVATCPRTDTEIDGRIDAHIRDREGKGWQTLEEQLWLDSAIRGSSRYDIILVDCLTLWINNHLYMSQKNNTPFSEGDVAGLCDELMAACSGHDGTIYFVTNEVGSGIVPESPQVRLYRDLVGRCNQLIAAACDHVTLVSCGIPLPLK